MTSNFSEHTNANYFIHSGHGQQGRPSMGRGHLRARERVPELPGFVVLNSGMIPPGGLGLLQQRLLAGHLSGLVVSARRRAGGRFRPTEADRRVQQDKLALLRKLDRRVERTRAGRSSGIGDRQLRAGLSHADPPSRLIDLSRRDARPRSELYGLDESEPTEIFGRQCLVARRLVERGVRFVESSARTWRPPLGPAQQPEGGHEDNARHRQPIAGLLKDLKARGLLDETLVVWGGEFGRTPMAQGTDGRDHNPFGFTHLAGRRRRQGRHDLRPTDDYGYYAVENKVDIHDLHATMLHLLGIDHKKLTFRFGGRDMRLTDVHGEVVREIWRREIIEKHVHVQVRVQAWRIVFASVGCWR